MPRRHAHLTHPAHPTRPARHTRSTRPAGPPRGLGAALALLAAVVANAAAPIGAEEVEGLVVPSRQVTLGSPLDGILETMPFEENTPVQQGDVVAKMDDRLQRVEVEKARVRAETQAAMREAEFVLEEQKIMLARVEEAQAHNAASEWEVRRAKLQVDQAQAGVENTQDSIRLAKTELRLQQQLLAQHELHAPFDGRVLRTLVEPGSTLQRGKEIVILVKLDPLQAEVFLPIEHYGRLQTGRTYALRPDPVISETPLQATLKTIDPVIDSASRTFRCVFTIPNPDEALPAGFSVFFDPDAVE